MGRMPTTNRVAVVALAASAFAAAGCVTPPYMPQRTGVVETAAPPEISYVNGPFTTAEGQKLYQQHWTPTTRVRAAVIFIHGVKDHASRYRDLAFRLAHHGLSVHTFDLRGHGYSEGVRDDIESAARCLDDLGRFLTRVKERVPGKPVFVAGQGYGATLAALWVLRAKPPVAGLVLSAPAARAQVPGGERFGTTMAAVFAPRSPSLDVKIEDWSSDRAVVEAMRRDPLVYAGSTPARTARELITASDEIQRRRGELGLPMLVLQGSADKVSDPEITRSLYEGARATDKRLEVYSGLAHDLLHEPARDQVIEHLITWLQDHATAATAAAAAKEATKSPTPPAQPPAARAKKRRP